VKAYLDSSALIKRVVAEPESAELILAVRGMHADGYELVTSMLGSVEVSRGVRARLDREPPTVIIDQIETALAGVAQIDISEPVIALARRLFPTSIRSLDAIHLASATLLDADVIVAYDQRLLTAASELGFRTLSPGSN
jgi:predicted nucleic acid-binding protein